MRGRSSPWFDARGVVRILYVFRAHQSKIRSIFRFVGRNQHLVLTAGDDRVASLWELSSGKLAGRLSRVNLDQPPEELWTRLFNGEIAQNGAQKLALKTAQEQLKKQAQKAQGQAAAKTGQQGGSLLLQLTDLKTTDSELFQPPPVRLECPPAAAYPWLFQPEQLFCTSGPLVSSAALSVKHLRKSALEQTTPTVHVEKSQKQGQDVSTPAAQGPVALVRSVVAQQVPVPTFGSSRAFNLYRSTGITPRLLESRAGSWTVRAAIGRATGFNVDTAKTSEDQVLNSVTAQLPESLLREAHDESSDGADLDPNMLRQVGLD